MVNLRSQQGKLRIRISTLAALVCASSVIAEEPEPWQQAAKTEVWEPVPPVIEALQGQPPSDAIVLLGDKHWHSIKGQPFPWQVQDGVMTVTPGTGDIKTREDFCDIQLHLEWRTPTDVEGMQGQQRHNSGVFLQQRYEVQILDSYDNPTYPNGQAASVYKQYIPLVNAMRPPGQWQQYDIIFTAPRFDADTLRSPGYVTVMHNGVVVQNHAELKGKTEWIGEPSYTAHGCAPVQLQDHGNPVSFRNIWVRRLD